MKIAQSKEDFEIAPLDFDGFIEKVKKRAIDMTIRGALYTINCHSVLCTRTNLPDGRTWYSYCSTKDELFESLSEERDWIASFSTGRDHRGLTSSNKP